MFSIIFTICIIVAATFIYNTFNYISFAKQTFEIIWGNFKKIYEKFKVYDAVGEKYRRNVFEKNLNIIKSNKNYSVNQDADLTPLEVVLKNYSSSYDPKDHFRFNQLWNHENIKPLKLFPENFDYTHLFPKSAYVQRNNACYAFTSVGLVEALLYRRLGKHRQFSVQEILDRSFCSGNNGEHGGRMMCAFQYIKRSGVHEADVYKYRCEENNLECIKEVCQIEPDVPKQGINSFHSLRPGASDQEIMTALWKYGPVAVGIFSNFPAFQNYKATEVINQSDAPIGEPDHAVILVGWRGDYWIIRNSWGPDWGDNGYALIQRGGNVLGINDHVSYITMDGHFKDMEPKIEPKDVDKETTQHFRSIMQTPIFCS